MGAGHTKLERAAVHTALGSMIDDLDPAQKTTAAGDMRIGARRLAFDSSHVWGRPKLTAPMTFPLLGLFSALLSLYARRYPKVHPSLRLSVSVHESPRPASAKV